MVNLIKKIESQIDEHGELSIIDTDEHIFISPDRLYPGDIITFMYKGADYSVILISTKSTKQSCYYVSSKGNKLITSIKVDFSLVSHNMFVKNILKKNKTKYSKLKEQKKGFLNWLLKWFSFAKKSNKERLLNSFMGATNFRTFIFNDMKTIKRVKLDSALELEQSDSDSPEDKEGLQS